MDIGTHTHTHNLFIMMAFFFFFPNDDDNIGVVADDVFFVYFLESDAALLRSRTGHYKVV